MLSRDFDAVHICTYCCTEKTAVPMVLSIGTVVFIFERVVYVKYKDSFSEYHPSVNFVYFTLVLLFSMFFINPVYLAISLSSACAYTIYLSGFKAFCSTAKYLVPMMILSAVICPAFNHAGVTVLTYFPSGNPLTLESILYGIATSVMLACVITWFSCFNAVITSDRFVYLFGRVIPALSLILSMTLRFVPRFKKQIRTVADAQRCIGRDVSSGSIVKRISNAVTILSIVITWSLEDAMDTANSMKSRGYGLSGRTAFSIYEFSKRDKIALLWLAFCGFYILAGYISGGIYFRFFPTVKGVPLTLQTASFALCHLALSLTPVIINVTEDRKWIRLRSGI